MKLLLFDIDGTLLWARSAGRSALETTLSNLFDRPVSSSGVSFGGKTDMQIIAEIVKRNGLTIHDGEQMQRVLDAYADRVCRRLGRDAVTVLPGVPDLIERLSREPEIQLGLVTGNVERAAYAKLDAASLAEHFPFGAFGSDSADRRQLPTIAVRRAQDYTGHYFEGKNVVIIGDTEHDVRCGLHLDVLSVGVCTGRAGRSAFEEHAPDVLLQDLRDADTFIDRVVRRT